MSDAHPKLEQLAAYVEAPATEEHSTLRCHLAACSQCRQQADYLGNLSANLAIALPTTTPPSLSEASVADFVDGRLPPQRQRELAAQLVEDDAALKAALHYASHAEAMRAHLEAPPPDPVLTETMRATPWQRLLAWRPPAWLSVPVTAAVAFAAALLVIPPLVSPPAPWVISYQDQPQLILQPTADELPGLGFFHTAQGRALPFAGLRAHYATESGLTLDWPPIEMAKGYHLSLSLVAAEGIQPVAKIDTRQPRAHFPTLELEPARRYQWTLSGQMSDDMTFHASGGLVVAPDENTETPR